MVASKLRFVRPWTQGRALDTTLCVQHGPKAFAREGPFWGKFWVTRQIGKSSCSTGFFSLQHFSPDGDWEDAHRKLAELEVGSSKGAFDAYMKGQTVPETDHRLEASHSQVEHGIEDLDGEEVPKQNY